MGADEEGPLGHAREHAYGFSPSHLAEVEVLRGWVIGGGERVWEGALIGCVRGCGWIWWGELPCR